MKKNIRHYCVYLFIVTSLMMGLVSCGFHLRGNIQIPEQALPVYVFNADTYHRLRRILLTQLKRSGIKTTSTDTNAETVVRILSLQKFSSVISVDSSGRTSEYKLGVTANINITINKRSYQKKMRVSKDVAFNPEKILSYKKEEKTLYNEMYSELSRLILLQLQVKAKRAF